jgi:hypothetical protein
MSKVVEFPNRVGEAVKVADKDMERAKADLARIMEEWDATDPNCVERRREAEARYQRALKVWCRYAITI